MQNQLKFVKQLESQDISSLQRVVGDSLRLLPPLPPTCLTLLLTACAQEVLWWGRDPGRWHNGRGGSFYVNNTLVVAVVL